MKTSYFKKSGTNPNSIAISVGVPPGYTGKRYTKLAPTREMVKRAKAGDKEFYWSRYKEMIAKLDPRETYNELSRMVEGEPILLCWEANVCDCHREFVGNWFKENLGVEVREFGMNKQMTLFP